MTNNLRHFNAFDDIASINAALESDGCVIIDGLLPEGELRHLRQAIPEILGEGSYPVYCDSLRGPLAINGAKIISGSSIARSVAANPLILNIMDYHLLKSCLEYRVSGAELLQVFPGDAGYCPQTDETMLPFVYPGTQCSISCVWSMDDFSDGMGGMMIAPGSHRWPTGRMPKRGDFVSGSVPAGSVLIYFGGVWRRSGSNLSDRVRTGFLLHYTLDWMRDNEERLFFLPRHQLRNMPSRLRRMFGFVDSDPHEEGGEPYPLSARRPDMRTHNRDTSNARRSRGTHAAQCKTVEHV